MGLLQKASNYLAMVVKQGIAPRRSASSPRCPARRTATCCGRRRSAAGRSTSAWPRTPSTVGRERDADWLRAFIVNPGAANPGEMPPYDSLPSEDLGALVAYLGTLR
jgi:hypothetical protein